MVEMRDVEHEAELFPQIREQERERGRIGAAGHSEHDGAGAEDRMGARV
jgi:hypothetical protein